MIALDRKVSDEFSALLKQGDAAGAERTMAVHLRSLPKGAFHIALDVAIDNSAQEVAGYLDASVDEAVAYLQEIDAATEVGSIGALYAEMNGFPENPEEWNFSTYAIADFGGREEFSWLGDFFWASERSARVTGMERLQEVFAAHRFQGGYDAMVAGQLVLARFQHLIQRAAAQARKVRMPLFASAHDGWHVFEVPRG
jgi:hypothetical protein